MLRNGSWMQRAPNAPAPEQEISLNPFARIAGMDAPAAAVLRRATARLGEFDVITLLREAAPHADSSADDDADYAQIDPALAHEAGPHDDPPPGVGYAGLTPAQRDAFLTWLAAPQHPAPLAFQQIYLAWLETSLLESLGRGHADGLQRTQRELARLRAWPQWATNDQHGRTLLFATFLLDDAAAMDDWLADRPSFAHLGIGLGLLARRGVALSARALRTLLAQAGAGEVSEPIAVLRLQSLHDTLSAEPLAWALAQAGESLIQPWRCAHRDLRLALQQPDLWPLLRPHVVELARVSLEEPVPMPVEEAELAHAPEATEGKGKRDSSAWRLVLEFGHSRSEYFDFALRHAQRMQGFVALLDENRHIVYRVTFRRSEMRRFWTLWDYVQGWSGTRVYVGGVEIDKWKVWPYSQYLQ